MFREPIDFHRMLLNDPVRMQAYRRAVQAVVLPGDVVLDVGCGSAILGLFAAQAGAARVYCVDIGPIVHVAKELAVANGFGDRMRFLRGDILKIELEEKVDVIQSELIGKTGIGQNMSEIARHCIQHFLKPGGRILPAEVTLHLAPVESAAAWEKKLLPGKETYGLDFAVMQRYADNLNISLRANPEELLAPAQTVFHHVAVDPNAVDTVRATLQFQFDRRATMHGYVLWFSTELAPGVFLDNAPPGTFSWDNSFFPLTQPLAVEPGDTVDLLFGGRADTDSPMVW